MNALQNKLTRPAMTREEYDELTPQQQYFIGTWDRMKKPETIKPVAPPSRALRVVVRAAKGGKR